LLEIERHPRLQSFGVGGRKAVEGLFDGASKVGDGRIVSAVEGATFNEHPQTFDQVQVGQVRREEQERDSQLRCQDPRKRPEATQECPEHELGRVHKEHVTSSRAGVVPARLQFGVEKIGMTTGGRY